MDSANIARSRSASLPACLSPSPLLPPSSAADGNGLDDRGNKEETWWGGGRGVQTEMEKFGRGNREEGGNGKMRNAGK